MRGVKNVKNVEDLKRLALATGARVEHGGVVFNESMTKAAAKPAAPPAAKPVAEEPEQDPVAEALRESSRVTAAALHFLSDQQTRHAAALERIAAPQLVPERPRCSWRFTIVRDQNGRIKHIVADPVKGT